MIKYIICKLTTTYILTRFFTELEPAFPYREVTIRRNTSIADSYEILNEIGR